MGNNNLPVRQTSSVPGSPIARVENAIVQSKKINASTEEEISVVLRYIMVLLGLKVIGEDAPDLPTPVEKAIIMEYLMEECANNTPEEIKLAFKLGLAGKTAIKQEDKSLYGKRFNSAFIAVFVNAYNVYKQNLYRDKLNKPDPNQKQLAEPKERPEDKAKVDAIIASIHDKLRSPAQNEVIKEAEKHITFNSFREELIENIKTLDVPTLESLIRDCVKHNDLETLTLINAEMESRYNSK